MELFAFLAWVVKYGAGAFAYFLVEKVPRLAAQAPLAKRIWAAAISAVIAIIGYLLQIAMLYEPAPIGGARGSDAVPHRHQCVRRDADPRQRPAGRRAVTRAGQTRIVHYLLPPGAAGVRFGQPALAALFLRLDWGNWVEKVLTQSRYRAIMQSR